MLFSKEELAVLDNAGYKKGYAKKLVFERFLEAFPGMEPTINRSRKVLFDKNLNVMVDVCYSEDGNRMTAYNEYLDGLVTFDGIIRLCIDMTNNSDPVKFPWFNRWSFREYVIYGRELTLERLHKIRDDLEFVFAKGLSKEELLKAMAPLRELLSNQSNGRDYEYFRSHLIRDECSSTTEIYKETIDSYKYVFTDDVPKGLPKNRLRRTVSSSTL